MADLRKAVPQRYPIRTYPDITHSQQCQFPVPNWDVAFSLTEGREVINPRPRQQATIFRYYQPGSIGFITYSEGCNDDVNKIVWSALGWDPEADIPEISPAIQPRLHRRRVRRASSPRDCLRSSETGRGRWRPTHRLTRRSPASGAASSPAGRERMANWRFQQALYRAYYDSFVRRRLIRERPAGICDEQLARCRESGSLAAIDVTISRYRLRSSSIPDPEELPCLRAC